VVATERTVVVTEPTVVATGQAVVATDLTAVVADSAAAIHALRSPRAKDRDLLPGEIMISSTHDAKGPCSPLRRIVTSSCIPTSKVVWPRVERSKRR
jgi:hypothetical protein